MLMKKMLCPLVMMLLVVTAAITVMPPEAAGVRLADVQEAAWAEQAIAEMSACEIITGYPDGYFRPYNNVTRMETMAMLVRVLGLEERAKENEDMHVDYDMPPDLSWGRGYIIMGVERGMLDRYSLDLFLVSYPATRLEVAALLYNALNLEAGGGSLTFDDANQIPADYRECVAAMVKNNIMEGLPGNLFGPNDNINRAQMAVLLSRLTDRGFADPCPERRYSGTLESIDPSGLFLTIRVGDYGILNKLIASDCDVYIDGARSALSGLATGDVVGLVFDKNDSVAFVVAKQAGAPFDYRGIIKSLFSVGGEYWLALTCTDGTEIIRSVAPDAKITYWGAPEDISCLCVGDYVEIAVAGSLVTEINHLDTGSSDLEGEITDIVTSVSYSITIRNDKGAKRTYAVADNVTVRWDGARIYFDELYLGDRVELELDGRDCVTFIEVIDEDKSDDLEGEITDIVTRGAYSITIRNDKGSKRTYAVVDSVTVRLDGASIYFEDLYWGDRVELELDSRDRVNYIEVITAVKPGDLEGEITDIVTSGAYSITIRNDEGFKKTYAVVDNVTVRLDGANIYFEDLYWGDRVKLELDSRDRVNYIEVVTVVKSSDLEGEITDIVTSGAYSITIHNDKGSRKTYAVIDNVTVRSDAGRAYFYDLYRGDRVRLELDERDRVTHVEIIKEDKSVITGTVTRIDTSKPQWLEIEDKYGRGISYDIARYATFSKDGARLDLKEIIIGCDVELEVRDRVVEKIRVTNDRNITVKGMVVSVNTSRQMITIEQDSGNVLAYRIADVFSMEDRDRSYIRMGDVERGWDVELKIEDGKIRELTRI